MFEMSIASHRPLRETVYEELKMRILAGNIVPGTRLMEVELAEEMGVSRTPVREAVRKLEKEGLVVIEPRRGAYVTRVSLNDLLEILDVRQNLEGFAAYKAAQSMPDDIKEELKRLMDLYDKAMKANDTQELVRYDTEFHHLIVKGTNNKILLTVIDQMYELVLRFRYLYYDTSENLLKVPEQHKAIVDAICSGDAEGARRASDEHLNSIREATIRTSEEREDD